MTDEEYEARKRHLDEELRAGVALLEAAHRHQIRALDLVRLATAERADVPAAAAAPAVPSPPARRRHGDLYSDVCDVLPRLPEVFDRNDVVAALGYEPERSSLYRTLCDLQTERALAVERTGSGKIPTQYRKTEADVPDSGA